MTDEKKPVDPFADLLREAQGCVRFLEAHGPEYADVRAYGARR
jgi:hypothetical protein